MDRQLIRDRLERSVGGADKLAGFFSARTFSDLNKRAASELDSAADRAIETLDRIKVALDREGLAEFGGNDLDFIERFVAKWAAYQYAGSRVLNWMITGPARFPVRSNEKRMDTEHRRLTEYLDFSKLAPARAVKAAKRARAQALGAFGVVDEELIDLKDRLAKREAAQAQMKLVNEVIRKGKFKAGDGEQLSAALKERGLEIGPNRAGMILNVESYERPGYQQWQLSNNNAEINRLKARVAQVEAKAQRVGEGAESKRIVNGVEVIEANADDRLRLVFDGKPPRETIDLLKSNGFRWSPTNGAWQRQLTSNARYAAERVLNQIAA